MGVVKSITCSNGRVTSASGGTIDTADISADAVTFAKLQNINSGKLLGRSTAGAGDAEEITVGTNLTLSGGTLSASAGGVTSVALAAPGQFTVTGSPVTTSGTLTLSWASAGANTVFAGPDGSNGTPAFRGLAASDIPKLTPTGINGKITNVVQKKILGRYSASDGDCQEIGLADGLRFDGSNLSMWSSVPASSGASGVAGQMAFDSSYFYVCIEPNTWARVALATW